MPVLNSNFDKSFVQQAPRDRSPSPSPVTPPSPSPTLSIPSAPPTPSPQLSPESTEPDQPQTPVSRFELIQKRSVEAERIRAWCGVKHTSSCSLKLMKVQKSRLFSVRALNFDDTKSISAYYPMSMPSLDNENSDLSQTESPYLKTNSAPAQRVRPKRINFDCEKHNLFDGIRKMKTFSSSRKTSIDDIAGEIDNFKFN